MWYGCITFPRLHQSLTPTWISVFYWVSNNKSLSKPTWHNACYQELCIVCKEKVENKINYSNSPHSYVLPRWIQTDIYCKKGLIYAAPIQSTEFLSIYLYLDCNRKNDIVFAALKELFGLQRNTGFSLFWNCVVIFLPDAEPLLSREKKILWYQLTLSEWQSGVNTSVHRL